MSTVLTDDFAGQRRGRYEVDFGYARKLDFQDIRAGSHGPGRSVATLSGLGAARPPASRQENLDLDLDLGEPHRADTDLKRKEPVYLLWKRHSQATPTV